MGNSSGRADAGSLVLDSDEMRKRHCIMRRKLLEQELDGLLADGRGEGSNKYRSKALLLERMKQVKTQMDQLERVEMSLNRISNIKQTKTMVKQVQEALGDTGNLPTADTIYELEDDIAAGNDTLNEIESAFEQSCGVTKKNISDKDFQDEVSKLFGGDSAPAPGGPPANSPPVPVQIPQVPVHEPSARLLTETALPKKKSQSSPRMTLDAEQ